MKPLHLASSILLFCLGCFATLALLLRHPGFQKTTVETLMSHTANSASIQLQPLFYSKIGQSTADSEYISLSAHPFMLDLGESSDESEALTTVETYRSKGVDAFYTPYKSGAKRYYRIQSGTYQTKEEAEDALKKTALLGIVGKVLAL